MSEETAVVEKKPRKKIVNPELKAKARQSKPKAKPDLNMPRKLKKLEGRHVSFDGALAAAWLFEDAQVREKTGRKNRKLTPSNVKVKYENMMNGTFVTTSQGPTIDSDGAIIDGQHTLNAIVMYYDNCDSPEPIELFIKEGENPEHFPFYDQGKLRTSEDVFGIANFDNPKVFAHAARMLWIRINGKRIAGAGKMSPYALKEFAETHRKGLEASINFILKFGRGGEDDDSNLAKSVMSEGHAAALHYLMANADVEGAKEKADAFWDLLINPERKSKLAPCRLARTLSACRNDPERSMKRDAIILNTIAAFNNYCDGVEEPLKLGKGEYPRLGGYDCSEAPETGE